MTSEKISEKFEKKPLKKFKIKQNHKIISKFQPVNSMVHFYFQFVKVRNQKLWNSDFFRMRQSERNENRVDVIFRTLENIHDFARNFSFRSDSKQTQTVQKYLAT